MTKKLKVLIAFDDYRPFSPEQDPVEFLATPDREAERDIYESVKRLGYEVFLLPVSDNVSFIVDQIKKNSPDIVFNQVEQFNGEAFQERNFVGLLEMIGVPYTGTSVSGLLLSKNKALAKKIIKYHRLRTPEFMTACVKEKLMVPKKMRYPMIVKPLREDASYGISQNSLVHDENGLKKRVHYIFESMGQDVLIEEYIIGREIYSGLLGNHRVQVFPPREMVFEKQPDEEQKIATFKAKWDKEYRKKWGIRSVFPTDLDPQVVGKIESMSRKMFKSLSLQGYARLDLRLTPEGEVVFLEANPNPHIGHSEDYALAAKKMGIEYDELIQKIISLGLKLKRVLK